MEVRLFIVTVAEKGTLGGECVHPENSYSQHLRDKGLALTTPQQVFWCLPFV